MCSCGAGAERLQGGQLHLAGVPLPLGWVQAAPYQLEGGKGGGGIKPTEISLQKDGRAAETKASSSEPWERFSCRGDLASLALLCTSAQCLFPPLPLFLQRESRELRFIGG